MSLQIVLRRDARTEFNNAANWYEARRAGLGSSFTAAVNIILNEIVAHPEFFPEVYEDVREAIVSRFPYCVYFFVDRERERESGSSIGISYSTRSSHLAGTTQLRLSRWAG